MIIARQLEKVYGSKAVANRVLKGISLEITAGEFVAIVGRSGAGKSTLLYQLSLLDQPTAGEVLIDNTATSRLSYRRRVAFRLATFGFVFQDYALLPELTALENVMVPLLMTGESRAIANRQASAALAKVGLGERLTNLPSQLSGGEQQRVSVARAVANKPRILFADEPTASLDRETASGVLALLTELHQAGQTIVMITHEAEDTKITDRIITLDDGQIMSDLMNR